MKNEINDDDEVGRRKRSVFEKSRTEVFGQSPECDCPCRHVSFSQAHLIANFDAHYLDNNALSRNELSAVQPRLRAHSRRRDLHDSAVK